MPKPSRNKRSEDWMCHCWIYRTVIRPDGAADCVIGMNLPRAPVAGDFIIAFPTEQLEVEVRKVVLLKDGCWVFLPKDRELDTNHMADDFWGVNVGEPLQEAINFYRSEGWKVESIRSYWDGGWEDPRIYLHPELRRLTGLR